MNTATRVYARGYTETRIHWGLVTLILGVLLSALGVVYAKDLNRRLFIEYQNLQQTAQESQMTWSRLLLEQGALSTQSRIQGLAQKQLNMVIPSSQHIVMIEDSEND